MAALDALFRPYSFKGLHLKNRIVMAPMTRSFSPGGVATEEVAQYYRRRAAADVGLIISEGVGVNRPASVNDKNVPRFHGDKELAAWKRVIASGNAARGRRSLMKTSGSMTPVAKRSAARSKLCRTAMEPVMVISWL